MSCAASIFAQLTQRTDRTSNRDAAGIARFGAIDALLHNAGFGLFGVLESTPRERIEEQFASCVGRVRWPTRSAPGDVGTGRAGDLRGHRRHSDRQRHVVTADIEPLPRARCETNEDAYMALMRGQFALPA
ncbi:MAG: hypothetical protein ABW352_01400 [Polyangiales bacterium]